MAAVEYATFPDSEALTATWLRQAPELPSRVYSSIPNNPTWPLILVERVGGVPVDRRWLDRSRIQVDVYGDKLKSQAADLAAQARSRLMAMEGRVFSTIGGDAANAFVSAVDDDMGLVWQPDPSWEPARPRYIFAVAVVLHP